MFLTVFATITPLFLLKTPMSVESDIRESLSPTVSDDQKKLWQKAFVAMKEKVGFLVLQGVKEEKIVECPMVRLEETLPEDNPYWYTQTLQWIEEGYHRHLLVARPAPVNPAEEYPWKGVQVSTSCEGEVQIFLTTDRGWMNFDSYTGRHPEEENDLRHFRQGWHSPGQKVQFAARFAAYCKRDQYVEERE